MTDTKTKKRRTRAPSAEQQFVDKQLANGLAVATLALSTRYPMSLELRAAAQFLADFVNQGAV